MSIYSYLLSQKRFKKEFVSFYERISGEDQKVGFLLAQHFIYLNGKRFPEFLSLMIPGAMIDSRLAGGKVDAITYCALLEKQKYPLSVFYEQVRISITGIRAEATGTLITMKDSFKIYRAIYRFEITKKNNNWLIASGTYLHT